MAAEEPELGSKSELVACRIKLLVPLWAEVRAAKNAM